ncbi:MAG TPA: hypothetical protein VMT76_02225 [Puia sp.]|nr:hypothetical protein [Puia sp.]
MNIEINTPPEGVKKWLTDYVKNKLVEIHHSYKNISGIHVSFKKHPFAGNINKICEIEFVAYGDSLFIYKEADNYENALRYAMNELSGRINEWLKARNEPPDETTSTVYV